VRGEKRNEIGGESRAADGRGGEGRVGERREGVGPLP